jgi:hypothetical protein
LTSNFWAVFEKKSCKGWWIKGMDVGAPQDVKGMGLKRSLAVVAA